MNRRVVIPYQSKRYYHPTIFNREEAASMREMIKKREVGRALSREWYTNETVYKWEIEALWKKNWLWAAFECEIPTPGDYVTYQIANENILLLRDDEYKVRAFYNVCRHRGARLCPESSGKVNNITCPYHSWTYNKSGKLIKASHMEQQINFDSYGLVPCTARTVEGLVFINLSDNPMFSFEPASAVMKPQLKHHRLADGKVAFFRSDIVKANWKLVYENNRECYHCANAHPDYIKANYDLTLSYSQLPDGSFLRAVDPNHPKRQEVLEHIEQCSQRWIKYDIDCAAHNSFPGDGWYRASRLPLRKGWVSESLDGKPVAPILGNFKEEDRDMGSLRIHILPNFWAHISSDHCVATRLTPLDPLHTRADQYWIVNKYAEEGKDYDLKSLLPFWERTNESDWEICELNQAGVLSDRYTPAPYSLKKESGVENFVNWYLRTLSVGLESNMKRSL
jgi:Rieske 2Fe-2S family protein